MSPLETYAWYFFAYSFLGWCGEVIFAALKNGRFVNRGFLNGPLCPLYGSGVTIVLLILQPYQNQLLYLYLGSVALTTLVELVTGWAMEKLFHQRWWDYSKMPLNIGGYVCPLFSLLWGFACVFIVDELHPRIARLIALVPEPLSLIFLCAFGAVFVFDLCVTVATVAKLNRRLTQLDEISAALKAVSDPLGETLADGALAVRALDEKARKELREKQSELRRKQAELNERLAAGQKRLLKAFPDLRSIRHPEALDALKERLHQARENQKH